MRVTSSAPGAVEAHEQADAEGCERGAGGGSCADFYDDTEYFTDTQLNTICWDAGYWQACGNEEYHRLDCSNLEGMIELGYDGGGDCPYCDGA